VFKIRSLQVQNIWASLSETCVNRQADQPEQVGFEPTIARNIPYSLPSNPAVRKRKLC